MYKLMTNLVRLNIHGLNTERLINNLKEYNINIYNIKRSTYDNIDIVIEERYLPIIKDFDIDVEVIEVFGRSKLIKGILDKIGIVIGTVISLIMLIILNTFTLHIEILGLENITREEVLTTLKEFGVDIWSVNNYNKESLHSYLTSNIDDISLVSSKKIGTTLVINIKEKSSTLEETAENYLSPYNMVIKDYSINSGKGNIYINQVVKKGDVLVYPEEYLDSDGGLHLIKPKGTIKACVWHTATETFMKQETVYRKTGNKIINYNYRLGSIPILTQASENEFEYFEQESGEYYISNFLLPIHYSYIAYYETIPEIQENDFNNSKEKIIANLQALVYNMKDVNDRIIDENVVVVELNDRFIINYYLECDTTIYI